MRKYTAILSAILIGASSLPVSMVSAETENITSQFGGLFLTEDDLTIKDSDQYSEEEITASITCSGADVTIEGEGVSSDGSMITITAAGTYVFTGTLSDGNIKVEAGDDDKVILIFNNFSIASSTGAAVSIVNADKVTISLPEGTENSVADGQTRDEEDEEDAAIYSKADLVLNGTGSLTVTGNYQDGIHGKDDVRIIEGTYEITAVDDGIVGKDRLEIVGGSFTIDAEGQGLKSTNTEDPEKGFIYIEDGSFEIVSGDDALHAETAIWITGGSFTLEAGDDGIHADETLTIDGGTIEVVSSVEGLEAAEIVLNGGDISVNASDDGINAAGGGVEDETESSTEFEMPEMSEMPEGFDGEMPDMGEMPEDFDGEMPDMTERSAGFDGEMPDGEVPNMPDAENGTEEISSSDSSGNNTTRGGGNKFQQMMGGGMGNMGGMFGESEGYLYINGGTIYVNAEGDGIDANSAVVQTGGDVVVEGPTNSGNGTLDYNYGYTMTGGTLMGTGSSGMLQTISSDSEVNCITIIFNTNQAAGTTVTISDSEGNVVGEATPEKTFSSVIFADEALTTGETYQVSVNNTVLFEVTIEDTLTTVDQDGNAGSVWGNMGGMGAMRGGNNGMQRDDSNFRGGRNRDENNSKENGTESGAEQSESEGNRL